MGVIENVVGMVIKKLGFKWCYFLVFILIYLFGLLGVVIGYENNIVMVLIVVVVVFVLGGDLIFVVGFLVGVIMVGFGFLFVNFYMVGMGYKIVELLLFFGVGLWVVFCFVVFILMVWYNVCYFK